MNDSERRAILGGNASRLFSRKSLSVVHPLTQEDSVAVAALRLVAAPMKGKLEGIAGRGAFNDIMEGVAVPDGVTFEIATIGGISGWWARPARTQTRAAIIHVHGGWFNWGTARAFRNFAGHVALRAEADVFIPDYRLAPEYRVSRSDSGSRSVLSRYD